MLNKNNVAQKVNVDTIVSNKMNVAIQRWSNIYHNKAKWLIDNDELVSLGVGQTIASEYAKKTTIQLNTKINGNDNLNKYYQKALRRLRVNLEFGLAKGGIIAKPFFDGNKLVTEFVQQDVFIPTESDSENTLTAVIFPTQLKKGKYTYTKLEYGRFENNTYTVKNIAFKSTSEDILGDPISLKEVPEWENISEEETIKNVDRPLFAYFGVPLANEIDPNSPLGPSIYSKAESILKEIDEQLSRTLWEYEGSELAIDVDETAFENKIGVNGNKTREIPKKEQRLFRKSDLDAGDKTFYNVFSPEIRDTSLFNGLNELLMRAEVKCGMSYGTLSKLDQVAKTATEIKSSKQTMYTTIKDIQTELEFFFDDLVYALDTLMKLYNLDESNKKYVLMVNWGDSILVDEETSKRQSLLDKNAGVIDDVQYIMETRNLDEDEAIAFFEKIRDRKKKYMVEEPKQEGDDFE